MKWTTLGIVIALAFGCGKSSDDKGKPSAESAASKTTDNDEGQADLAALAKLKDELCACKDAACGSAVDDKLRAKSKEMDATYRDSHNKNILHHASETEMAAKECLFKLK